LKALVHRVAERIDAATLRERVSIFLAATALLAFVAYATVLDPLRDKQKRIDAETRQIAQELQAVQAKLPALMQNTARDPDAPNRGKLEALREQLLQLNARVVQEQRRFTPPERMRDVLQEMLRRGKGLTLVELKTLPVAPVGTPPAGAPTAGGAYRHGVEFSISGSYGELYEYLRMLERLPTQIYWARAELVVSSHPVLKLKLTAYTVSFDPAWLIV
jgi:MSHA biogenesis protein MshJ